MAVARNGKSIATGHKFGVVRIWEVGGSDPIQKLVLAGAGHARPIYSPDGRELAVLMQGLSRREQGFGEAPGDKKLDAVRDVVPAGVVFFETGKFTPVRHWQFSDGKHRLWHANRPPASLNPQRIAYSPDGKNLLVGVGGVTLIEVATGKVVRQFDLK